MSYGPNGVASPWLGGRSFRITLAVLLTLMAVVTFVRDRRVNRAIEKGSIGVAVVGPQRAIAGRAETYRAFALNDRDGSPIPNINVRLICGRQFEDAKTGHPVNAFRTLGSTHTDQDGVATFRVEVPSVCLPNPAPADKGHWESPGVLLGVFEAYGAEYAADISLENRSRGDSTSFLATDKPIYQPGQTVRIRGLLLDTELKPDAKAAAVLEVEDPKGNKVFKRALEASDFGNAYADFALADQVNLGPYTIKLTSGGSTSQHVVEVNRYALPKFEVALSTPERAVAPGSMLTARVNARWFFGEPVKDASVWVWVSAQGDETPPKDVAPSKTDSAGNVSVNLPVGDTEGEFFLSARVREEGGDERMSSVPITVFERTLIAELIPEGGPLIPGIENSAFILTSLPYGQPVRAKVTIEPGGPTVETSADGVARVTFVPTQAQALRITSLDGDYARTWDLPRFAKDPTAAVQVRPHHSRYAAGAGVRATATATGQDGQRVFIDLAKGNRVLDTGVCRLKGGRCDAELLIPDDTAGLVLVRAAFPTIDTIGYASSFILVDGQRGLDIDIRADKPVYAPAGTARLAFHVRGQNGAPALASLSVAGVDEAVFALADARPDLQEFFFGVGRDLAEEASTEGKRYGYRSRYSNRDRPSLNPDPVLLRDRTPELLRVNAQPVLFDAMLAALSSQAPRPEPFDAGYKDWSKGYYRSEAVVWSSPTLTPGALFLLFTAVFVVYVVRRIRRGRVRPVLLDTDIAAWKKVTRGLLTTWATGCFVPIIALIVLEPILKEVFNMYSSKREPIMVGAVLITALVPLGLLVRALLRTRKTKVAWALGDLDQVAWLLPASLVMLYTQLTVLLLAGSRYVRPILEQRIAWVMALAGMAILAQLVFGGLSVIRNASTEHTSMRRRLWLFLSRASFVGLPISLFVFLFGVVDLHTEPDVRIYLEREYEEKETDQVAEVNADSKEGGTGSRAKGQEGSEDAEAQSSAGVPAAKLRSHFPETLLWVPEVRTDESGNASLTVPLADSITTWQLSASAISRDGAQGSKTAKIRVMQDFFGDVSLPATLTQKDETSVPVSVFNYLEAAQSVRVSLELDEGLEALDGVEKVVAVGPNQVRGLAFRVRARLPGKHGVRVRFEGTELVDALERTVLVEPDGFRVEQTFNGTLPDNARYELEIPDTAIPGGNDVYVKVYGGVLSQVAEALDGAFRRPYGCFEQTSSATYSNVLVLDYLRRIGRSSPAIEDKALGYIGTGLQRLLSYEVTGGGYSWYGRPPGHTILTAYGLLEFHDMARVYDVDPSIIERTRRWLYEQQEANGTWKRPDRGVYSAISTQPDEWIRTTSYIAWALAETGDSDPRLGRALDQIERGDVQGADERYTLALRVIALAAAGRKAKATELLNRLVPLGIRDAKGLRWTSNGEGITYSYGATRDVELTALTVQAMARLQAWPEERTAALTWLGSQRDSAGTWYSTQATVAALRAMLTRAKPSVPGDVRLEVLVNGTLAGGVAIPEKEREVHRLVSLRDQVHTGKNLIEFRSRDTDVSYQVVGVHYLPWADVPDHRREAPISLSVSYDRKSVKVGDVVSCRATVTWNRESPARMTMVELGVPPGFEVERYDLSALVSKNVISEYQVKGNRVIVYLGDVSREAPVTFSFGLRAETEVRAAVPTSVAYPYYEPETRAESKPQLLAAKR